ncbi:arginine--tRNA ligase [Paenibacillus dendritiformis]|uniref:arginine--tRNA ligase n=1 Tax=Paenibacillus dendritiformis TaxID=130049 RepID=UPI0018CF5894|nr:arginine--tRNA ligase [Paenibacillus dendritiformis]MBG9791711.1 arginine--tRNA ligase [Paenibacillus dendritiformis]
MLKHAAAELLQPLVQLPMEELLRSLELPPKPELGDYAYPCFPLAKRRRQAAHLIAAEIAAQVNDQGRDGVRAEAAGGYVNLYFDPTVQAPKLLERMLQPDYGRLHTGAGKRVVIDMSSPNIAKPFGIGHLRSTVIGNALANLYKQAGYEVEKVNHLGDWGTQFGKLIAAYRHWGDEEALRRQPIEESLKLYVKFHEEAERHPELEDEAREWFRKLEQGDAETLALWSYFVDVSMEEFNRVYERLGVQFDHVLGESFYNDKMGAVVERLTELGLLEESDGAMVVRLDEEGMPPCLILKSNGTTIYPTRDLATAIYRKGMMGADKLLYVVGAEQQLHFRQVYAVLRKMGYAWAEDCEHVAFGLMTFNGKKMSTRRGKVVFLDEVLNEAVAKAMAIVEEKNPQSPDKESIAEAIGVGAIVFGDVKNSRMLSVDFQLEEALRFEGETAPYMQYTYARTLRLLEKGRDLDVTGGQDDAEAAAGPVQGLHLSGPEAWACVKTLSQFEETVAAAVQHNEPSLFVRLLLEAAKQFNRFYHHEPILVDDPEARRAKLALTAAVSNVLRQGLRIIGIQTPARI